MSALLWFVLPVVAIIIIRNIREARKVTPPGPPSHPIIGHLLSFPLKDRAVRLHELSDIYGKIFLLSLHLLRLTSQSRRRHVLQYTGPKNCCLEQ